MNRNSDAVRLGILYPVGGGEWEYYRFAEALGWRVRPCLFATPLFGEERNHDPAELARTAALSNLTRTARSIAPVAAHAAVWGCTSGSFILGRAHAEAQARAIAAVAGCPASSTSLAFVNALLTLGARRVALLASYPRPTTDAFVAFFAEFGIEVVALRCLDAPGGQDAFELPFATLLAAARELVRQPAEALVIPDTAMAGFDLVRALETELPIPVLAANQVTLWEGLRIAGRHAPLTGHGRLFATPAAAPHSFAVPTAITTQGDACR